MFARILVYIIGLFAFVGTAWLMLTHPLVAARLPVDVALGLLAMVLALGLIGLSSRIPARERRRRAPARLLAVHGTAPEAPKPQAKPLQRTPEVPYHGTKVPLPAARPA